MDTIMGIDVSKRNLDICILDGGKREQFQIANNISSIKGLIKRWGERQERLLVVMEATGVYHLRLATQAYERGLKVGVINPFVMKRYAEVKMVRAKTDRVDAKVIANYGREHREDISLFKPLSCHRQRMIKLLKAIDDLMGTEHNYSNRLEAEGQEPHTFPLVKKVYKEMIKRAQALRERLEQELKKLVETHYPEEYEKLTRIQAVGSKTASIMIAFFGHFESFESSKQVISYIGTNPSPKQSGTSLKGRGKISKKGNSYIRKYLFMTTLTAMKHNKACSQLYQRLIQKGKENKVARIAVLNKLVRQIFAIVKYNRDYDPDYELKFKSPLLSVG